MRLVRADPTKVRQTQDRHSRMLEAFCQRAADKLVGEGAQAVVLVGSHATGTAQPESDVDLIVLGDGPEYQLSAREGRLLALSWRTAEDQRMRFLAPQSAILEIPAWRSSVLIRDGQGTAAALQAEARSFSWALVADDAARWVAAELTGWAEEVHKLAAGLRGRRPVLAAVQRNLIATRVPKVMAVHLGTLVVSENDIWEVVARSLGERWREVQRRALSLDGQSLTDSCHAALEMYCEAVALAAKDFNERQRPVVDGAVRLAGEILAG
jgi:predicted nucleotidyltransferase